MLRQFGGNFLGPDFATFAKEIGISTAQNRILGELQIGQILSVVVRPFFFWTPFGVPRYIYEGNFTKITLFVEGKVVDSGSKTVQSDTLPC